MNSCRLCAALSTVLVASLAAGLELAGSLCQETEDGFALADEGCEMGGSSAGGSGMDVQFLQLGLSMQEKLQELPAAGVAAKQGKEPMTADSLGSTVFAYLGISGVSVEGYRNWFTFLAVLVLLAVITWSNGLLPAANREERPLALDGACGVAHIFFILFILSRKGVLPGFERSVVAFPAFFVMSGFMSGYVLPSKLKDNKFGDMGFVMLRFVRLYPTYWLAIALALFVVPQGVAEPYLAKTTLGMEPFLSNGQWMPDNPIIAAGWFFGITLYLLLLTPALLRLVLPTSAETRWFTLMPLAFFLTAVAAWEQTGHVATPWRPFTLRFLWVPHVPEYFMGLVLGMCFRDRKQGGGLPMGETCLAGCLRIFGSSFSFALLCLATIAFDSPHVPGASSGGFMARWAEQGLLSPLVMLGAWQLASTESYDPLRLLLASRPFVALSNIARQMLLLQQVVFLWFEQVEWPPLVATVLPRDYLQSGSAWWVSLYFWILAAMACFVVHLFEVPVCYCLEFAARRLLHRGSDLQGHREDADKAGRHCWLPWEWNCSRILLYYIAFAATFVGYLRLCHLMRDELSHSQMMLQGSWVAIAHLSLLGLVLLCCLPGVVVSFFGHLLHPSFVHRSTPSAFSSPESSPQFPADGPGTGPSCTLPFKLRFRWVTCGTDASNIVEGVKEAQRLLQSMRMRPESYALEVVTCNFLGCANLSGVDVAEIVVHHFYRSPIGTKFKARAVNYAIKNSVCSETDWIVHLDEETRLSEAAVEQIWGFAWREHDAVLNKEKKYRNIGQGIKLYAGSDGEARNCLTKFCDSLRVSDGCGKFRQELDECFVGMPGSFLVVSQQVAEMVSFDHGNAGSVCEDLFFMAFARGKYGVGFSWIDGFMYDQSQASISELLAQRQRWYRGLLLVMKSKAVPWTQRAWLALSASSWPLVPLAAPMFAVAMFTSNPLMDNSFWLWLCFSSAMAQWAYVHGFLMTFRPEDGLVRFMILLSMQVLGAPFYGLLEAYAAGRGLTRDESETSSSQASKTPAGHRRM